MVLGIIHKNMSIEDQAAQVRKVKKFESGVVKDPITISPQTTVREVMELSKKFNFMLFQWSKKMSKSLAL